MSIDVKIKNTLLILTIINFSFVFLEVDNANAQANNPPIASPDTAFTTVEKPVNINVLANDSDPDGDPLTVDAISGPPTFGTAEILPNKSIRYTPEPLFDGEDNFSYDISDGRGGNDTTSVRIIVDPISGAPLARNDDVSTPENIPIIIDVLTNDVDREGDPLRITAITPPSNGENTINDGGTTITYTPNANFVGVDTFTYTIFDGVTGTDTATVTVTVIKDIPPVLNSIGNKESVENIALTFTATATDADIPAQTLSFSLVGAPPGASITSAGVFTWTPTEAQGPGSYTFDVVVSDGIATDMETIVVTVSEVNIPPVLNSIGNKESVENIALTFTATATDADIPAQTLSFSLVGAPPGASITSAGVFTWTPTEAQGPGSYTFSVVVSDGIATDMETIIVVTVSGVPHQILNTPGKITAGSAQINKDTNLGFNIQFSKNALKGQLEYQDKTIKLNLRSVMMTALNISPDKTMGIFSGSAMVNGMTGYTFFVEVKDGGEPSKNDTFRIIIPELRYIKSGTIMKGNIQIY